jgi:hypothetical protein
MGRPGRRDPFSLEVLWARPLTTILTSRRTLPSIAFTSEVASVVPCAAIAEAVSATTGNV